MEAVNVALRSGAVTLQPALADKEQTWTRLTPKLLRLYCVSGQPPKLTMPSMYDPENGVTLRIPVPDLHQMAYVSIE